MDTRAQEQEFEDLLSGTVGLHNADEITGIFNVYDHNLRKVLTIEKNINAQISLYLL